MILPDPLALALLALGALILVLGGFAVGELALNEIRHRRHRHRRGGELDLPGRERLGMTPTKRSGRR